MSDKKWNIKYFDIIDSTQKYLLELIKCQNIDYLCVYTRTQSAGVGSRGNIWEHNDGGLYFSFSMHIDDVPLDLPRQSASIFFGFIFKEYLRSCGYDVWLKWPNDIYYETKKVGGIMTNITQNHLICGIGINFYDVTKSNDLPKYQSLPKNNKVNLANQAYEREFLEKFLKYMKNFHSWKQTLSIYKLEFQKFITKFCDNSFYIREDDHKLIGNSDEFALQDDGSIMYRGKKIYSLR